MTENDDRVLVRGEAGDSWHHPCCLVARYPLTRSDADGFPWCTCRGPDAD